MRSRLTPDQLAAAMLADLAVRRERRHRHRHERYPIEDRVVESCPGCGETRVYSSAGALLGYVPPPRHILVLVMQLVLLLACPACSSDPQIGWAEEWADFVSILRQDPAIALALLLLFPLLLYVAHQVFMLVLDTARWLYRCWGRL